MCSSSQDLPTQQDLSAQQDLPAQLLFSMLLAERNLPFLFLDHLAPGLYFIELMTYESGDKEPSGPAASSQRRGQVCCSEGSPRCLPPG
jgi:hypothetical protein